ncbi:MAG: EAL domain-containing protein [Lachnospiraceae bacterium]|nr:EAL domain-containing protein [Lachnospiraceae bacterium]
MDKELLLKDVYEAMSSNYKTIILVDCVNENITVYRKNPLLPQEFWDDIAQNPSYDHLIKSYVSYMVIPEDREKMLDTVCLSSLKRILKKQSAFSYDYRIEISGKLQWYRIRITNLSDLNRFAVSFEDITEEIRNESAYFKTGHKILIIDSSKKDREPVISEFSEFYTIIEADTFEEGLISLENNYEDISVIIMDLNMNPETVVGLETIQGEQIKYTGYDFLRRINGVRRYSTIPIISCSANPKIEDAIKALECGATYYVAKPYNVEMLTQTIRSLIRLQRSMALINTAEKDPLTGFYTKDFFYHRAEEILSANPETEYRFVVADIEKFKLINDLYGIETGDKILRHIATTATRVVPNFVIGGRITGDIFVYMQTKVTQNREDGMKVLNSLLENAPVPNLVLKHGIYYPDSSTKMSVQAMCDRARLACESIKGMYGVHCAVYDDKLRKDMLIQQQVIENMDIAIENDQFEIYLQPKHDMHTDKTGGAEALVRWIHPELGFINPGVFIPIFEQNGFIKKLDLYVFTKVCQTLKRWKDEGKQTIPISVNLSRRDFENENLYKKLSQIVDSYGIEHELIHLELTESALSDNPEQIKNTIKKFHENGFTIELDDFGTGYSSLTMLNSIDLDIIKLDMSIIKNDNPNSDKNILDFCMQLVKILNLQTVAEGAESETQTERLKSLGCDYIQGYFYSKPLPIEQFEQYLLSEKG